MRFSASFLLSALLATAIASPMPKKSKGNKAAAKAATSNSTTAATAATASTAVTAATAGGANVLTVQSYAQFQVSDGVAGNAQAEVAAKFPIDMSNLASVSDADHQIIKDARQVAESAETDAFNPAIDAATGDAVTALQNGKIKNKVLKLSLEVMDLMISQAQGDDKTTQIAAEQKKLDNNIALDTKAAGQASTGVSDTFTG